MNGVQTRFKCKLDVKRCKRFVFPPSSLLPRSNALKTKAIRYFQTDRTLTRIVSPPLYLTVHFYGAMLYFVGFYVLLLFDIVLCIQVENLTAITASEQTMAAYLQNSFFSAGYLMAASIVALKCLNLVPDLAAWMIPEGDTAFSTRNFGEGVAQQAKMTATGAMGTVMR